MENNAFLMDKLNKVLLSVKTNKELLPVLTAIFNLNDEVIGVKHVREVGFIITHKGAPDKLFKLDGDNVTDALSRLLITEFDVHMVTVSTALRVCQMKLTDADKLDILNKRLNDESTWVILNSLYVKMLPVVFNDVENMVSSPSYDKRCVDAFVNGIFNAKTNFKNQKVSGVIISNENKPLLSLISSILLNQTVTSSDESGNGKDIDISNL